MREFTDLLGTPWIATVEQEDTPRHHGRWSLVFQPAAGDAPRLPAPEVRWQTRDSAQRTIATMSLFELRRRLAGLQRRAGLPVPSGEQGIPWISRTIRAG